MTLKQLVVYLDAMPECEDRMRVAVDLATRHGAHLVGTYVAPTMLGHASSAAWAVGEGLREMIAHYKRLEEERAAGVREQFMSLAGRQGLTPEWRVVPHGTPPEEKLLSARYADLAIVGQRDEEGAASGWLSLLLSSGGPTLVIPQSWRGSIAAERIALAWNATRESRRAALDALPFLKAAKSVTVLVVDPRNGVSGHGDEPGADIARYLARHGVCPEVAQIASNGVAIGDVIVSRLTALEADLLVMGAYGHSRIAELILGGVTRSIIKHMTVPTLMSN